ncbi:hypothetical protein DEU32_105125 [Curtobacterium sp. AG1037]|uniref:hypothetical protein n=1 Tax=Curtobacterium sp. AG1037 TaxID=2183990 RepID=UPI000E2D98AB|nr:hypothetical protein [Curtobacterium sp. AG1037]RDH98530.1 hypothetical protein DEU32_105125 [Curtobacterium sp. AG1037]
MTRARAIGRQASLTSGFAVNMLILAVAGLIIIPALIVAVGAREWANIAVAQAIGGFCGVLTGYGWGLAGPTYVARADWQTRRLRYLESLGGRSMVALAAIPFGLVILFLVIGRFSAIASLALVVTAAVAFSPGWFYVGIGQPWRLIVIDTIPRAVSTMIAVVWLAAGLSAAAALMIQLAGIATGVLIASLNIGSTHGSENRSSVSLRGTLRVLRAQSHGMVAAATSSAFTAMPIVLVGIIAPAALPVYAVFDKVQRQFASAVSPVVQVSQGYVARAEGAGRADAVRRVTAIVVAIAVVGFFIFLLFGRAILHLLVARSLTFTLAQVGVLGAALALILVEQAFGHAVLATAGKMQSLARATMTGAVIGLVLVAVGASVGGAVLALIGFEVGLAIAILLQVIFAARVSSAPSSANNYSRSS